MHSSNKASEVTRLINLIGFTAAVILLAACQRTERRAELLPPNAAACQPNAYFVELPPGHEFRLNGNTHDSTQTMRWVREVLARRDSSGKYVNVRADSSRSRDLHWLVIEMQKAGARAYQFDSSCHVMISSR